MIVHDALIESISKIFNESEAAVYAAELIDFYLGENLEHLSETLVKK